METEMEIGTEHRNCRDKIQQKQKHGTEMRQRAKGQKYRNGTKMRQRTKTNTEEEIQPREEAKNKKTEKQHRNETKNPNKHRNIRQKGGKEQRQRNGT